MHAFTRMAAAGLIGAVLLFQGCTSSSELTPDERALLITVAEFEPYMKGGHDQTRGLFAKETGLLDHSKLLSYEFTFDKDAHEPALYVNCMVDLQPKGSQAVSRAAREIGMEIGLASGKLKQVPLEGFPKYGDRSSLSLLTLNGDPVGNLFTAEYGSKSVMLVFSGIYVRDPAAWGEMFGKKLRLLEAYDVSAAKD